MAVRDSSPFIHVPISPARAHPRCLKLFISSFRPILIRSNCLRLHPSCISDAAASLPLLSCATVPSLPLPLCAVWRRFYTYSCRRSRQSHLGLVRRSAEARRVCGEWMRLSLRQYNLAHASAVGVRPDANPLPKLRCSCRCVTRCQATAVLRWRISPWHGKRRAGLMRCPLRTDQVLIQLFPLRTGHIGSTTSSRTAFPRRGSDRQR